MGDLKKEIAALKTVLSTKLQKNLQDAYNVYLRLTNEASDKYAEPMLDQCDDESHKNEEKIRCILKKYAFKIGL